MKELSKMQEVLARDAYNVEFSGAAASRTPTKPMAAPGASKAF